MHLPKSVVNLIDRRTGFDANAPKAFYSLALDIKNKTGETIGENTLRRLFGILEDEREPRMHTLDVLARYLSMPDWKSLMASLNNEYSHIDTDLEIVKASDLSDGDSLELTWFPDRKVRIVKSNDESFVVAYNENSKLCVGDVFSVSTIAQGFPFIATDVCRDSKCLGSYVGAEENGILTIRKI